MMVKRTIRKPRQKKYFSKHEINAIHGEEPTCDGKILSGSEIFKILNWYSSTIQKNEHKKKWFLEWCVETQYKNHLSKFKKIHHSYFSTIGVLARLLNRGANFSDDVVKSFEGKIHDLINKPIENEQPKEKVVTVKQSIEQKVISYIGQLECEIDTFIENGFKTNFSMKEFLINNEIKPILSKDIGVYFNKLAEEIEASMKDDEYAKESWSHLNKSKKRKMIEFLTDITFYCSINKKERKPRKRKEKTPEQLTKGIKCLEKIEEYGIETVKPKKLIGAKEAWVFNYKYNSITVYRASNDIRGLLVKGTAIKEFDEDNSSTRRLRKPKEFLDSIKDQGKRNMKKEYESLTTKPSKVNGRVNRNCLILKVF